MKLDRRVLSDPDIRVLQVNGDIWSTSAASFAAALTQKATFVALVRLPNFGRSLMSRAKAIGVRCMVALVRGYTRTDDHHLSFER